MAKGYKKLVVWKKSKQLALEVYELTNQLPDEEKYGLSSQMRRAAISIPSNIAEGKMRESDKELRRFLLMAYGSAGELETQIEISKELGYLSKTEKVENLLDEVMRMLNVFINDKLN